MDRDAGLAFGLIFLLLLGFFIYVVVMVLVNLATLPIQIGFCIAAVIWIIIKVGNRYDAKKKLK